MYVGHLIPPPEASIIGSSTNGSSPGGLLSFNQLGVVMVTEVDVEGLGVAAG